MSGFFQEADCQGDPLEGDLVTWAEEKWVTEDDVTIAPLARETVRDKRRERRMKMLMMMNIVFVVSL